MADSSPLILIVSDSNGKRIDLDRVKPGALVCRHIRYTTEDALADIPEVVNPHRVFDLVLQIGLNDSRHGVSTQTIRENLLEIQLQYRRVFPNARQHLTELPPIGDAQVEVNTHIRRLASYTGSQLISTKQFLDRTTSQLRLNTVAPDGYHYSDIGVKILAKEIKKSLFSYSNREGLCLTAMNNIRSLNVHNGF